jgi:hypothetical protein
MSGLINGLAGVGNGATGGIGGPTHHRALYRRSRHTFRARRVLTNSARGRLHMDTIPDATPNDFDIYPFCARLAPARRGLLLWRTAHDAFGQPTRTIGGGQSY